MTEATLRLNHNQFQVTGPADLVLWINSLSAFAASGEVKHAAYMKRLEKYYVRCSVTGDQIPLSELKYWNVERQEAYRDASIGLARYTEIS